MVSGLGTIDRRTKVTILAAGLVFVLIIGLAMTGNAAADAGQEVSSCFARFH